MDGGSQTVWARGKARAQENRKNGAEQVREAVEFMQRKGVEVKEDEAVGAVVNGVVELEKLLASNGHNALQNIEHTRMASCEIQQELKGYKQYMDDSIRNAMKPRRTLNTVAGAVIAGMRMRGKSSFLDAVKDETVNKWLGMTLQIPTSPATNREVPSPIMNSISFSDAVPEPLGDKGPSSFLSTLCSRRTENESPCATEEQRAEYVKVQPPDILRMQHEVSEWSFEAKSELSLSRIAVAIMSNYSLVHTLSITPQVVAALFADIGKGYQGVVYHNEEHACDVLQTTHSLVYSTGLVWFLTDIEILSLLVSAAGHDYGHPGLDNHAFANLQPEVCQLFGGASILEKAHIAGIQPIIESRLGFLGPAILDQIKSKISTFILATDITKQVKMLRSFHADPTKDTLLCLVLHAADVSGPVKPRAAYLASASRVITEFWLQGDLQREMNIPISPMCDKENVKLKQLQLGFIGVIVKPLFLTLNKWLGLSVQLDYLESNVAFWSQANHSAETDKVLKDIQSAMVIWHKNNGVMSFYADTRTMLKKILLAILMNGETVPSNEKAPLIVAAPTTTKPDSYRYPGVATKKHQPMFAVVKVEKEHMPLTSYPLSVACPLVLEDNLRSPMPSRKLVPVQQKFRLKEVHKSVVQSPIAIAEMERVLHEAISRTLQLLDAKATSTELYTSFTKVLSKSASINTSHNHVLSTTWNATCDKWQLSKKQGKKLRNVWDKWLREKDAPRLPALQGLAPQPIVVQRF